MVKACVIVVSCFASGRAGVRVVAAARLPAVWLEQLQLQGLRVLPEVRSLLFLSQDWL